MSSCLDLKYRPKKFSDIVGNSGVINLLLRRSRSKTLSGRSMMFGGPKGCGKTSLARIVAMAIVCDDLNNGEPCSECESCISVTNDSSSEVDEFDAATQGTVDRIRSIIEDLEYGSVSGKPRVIILDEAQRLSKPAQDALLKAVEDRKFVVIFCTTEPHKIGEAIRSRLEEYPISTPSESEIVSRLEHVCKEEGITYELEALEIVAKQNKCCPRTSLTSIGTLSLLDGVTIQSTRSLFRYESMETLIYVLSKLDSDPLSSFESLDMLFVRNGASWVRDNMVAAITSSMRSAVGARYTYPIQSNFYKSRGVSWGDLARGLGHLDRPTQHDIEAVMLSSCVSFERTDHARPVDQPVIRANPAPTPLIDIKPPTPTNIQPSTPVNVHPPISVDKPKPPSQKIDVIPRKSLEIDGVKYTHDEKLTSLDHKIEPGGRAPISPPPIIAEVELDKFKIPISEKEFSRGLVSRMSLTGRNEKTDK